MKLYTVIFILFACVSSYSQSIFGTWKSIDEEGAEKSYVQIYEQNGKVFGKITKLLNKPADTKCDKCKGERKDQPVMGMIIIENLTNHNGTYKGGKIYDPVTGNVYGCSLWLESGKPNELRLRGIHWTGIYRTQTWHKVI